MTRIDPTALRRTQSAPMSLAPVQEIAFKRAASTDDAMEFGVRNGRGISNPKTILPELWQRLGHDGPPKVAVVFVEPFADRSFRFSSFRSDSTDNPFGHAALAYPKDGKLTVMNVVGCAKPALVNSMTLEDYLFSTHNWDSGSEQSGIYNRSFRIFALWNVDDAKLQRLDDFYTDLCADAEKGKATYNMNFPRILNWLRQWFMPWLPRSGNCASYTGDALVAAGLMKKTSMWPKQILMSAWRENRDRRNQTKLVTFEKAVDAPLAYGKGSLKSSLVSPSLRAWWANFWQRDLTSQSDAVVQVPAGSTTAELRVNRPERYANLPPVPRQVEQAPMPLERPRPLTRQQSMPLLHASLAGDLDV